MGKRVKITGIILAFALTVGCRSEKPRLHLTYSPRGATVTIDGFEPEDYSSPHTFEFYKPGEYRLDIFHKGYIPVSMMVEVAPGAAVSKEVRLVKLDEQKEAAIAVDSAQDEHNHGMADSSVDSDEVNVIGPETDKAERIFEVAVESSPSGAKVASRRLRSDEVTIHGRTPLKFSLSSNSAYKIELSLTGYRPVKRTVVKPAGGGTVVLNERLKKHKGNVDVAGPVDEGPVEQISPALPGKRARISIETNPASTVTIDGKKIGRTPLENIEVSTGLHKILFENRELGRRKTEIVNIEKGQHLRLAEDL